MSGARITELFVAQGIGPPSRRPEHRSAAAGMRPVLARAASALRAHDAELALEAAATAGEIARLTDLIAEGQDRVGEIARIRSEIAQALDRLEGRA